MKIVIPGGSGQDRGGIFSTLLALVRFGVGGRVGDGRQFVSWIHETDFIRAVCWLIDREHLDGAVNLAAPNPLPQREFMAFLRQARGSSIGLPATKWMLELGAILLHRNRADPQEPPSGAAPPARGRVLVSVP